MTRFTFEYDEESFKIRDENRDSDEVIFEVDDELNAMLSCEFLNKQEELILHYKYSRDGWKRTAGEELSNSTFYKTRLELIENEINNLMEIYSAKNIDMSKFVLLKELQDKFFGSEYKLFEELLL